MCIVLFWQTDSYSVRDSAEASRVLSQTSLSQATVLFPESAVSIVVQKNNNKYI